MKKKTKSLFRNYRVVIEFFILVACLTPAYVSATPEPAEPIDFQTPGDYDFNFKENGSYTGIEFNQSGSLSLSGSPTGIAVFDRSAEGGEDGVGGTSGADRDNEFSDFTVFAEFSADTPWGISGGFLLRLDDSERNGYHVRVRTINGSPYERVEFSIFRNADTEQTGFPIFSTSVDLVDIELQADVFYPFKVTVSGQSFAMDFGGGAAVATYTASLSSPTVGQVGIVLNTLSSFTETRLNNFAVIPDGEEFYVGGCPTSC